MSIAIIMLPALLMAQSHRSSPGHLHGQVKTINDKGKEVPLPFASIYWIKSHQGTTSDENGQFHLPRTDSDGDILVLSFVGYISDTIKVESDATEIGAVLKPSGTTLGGVEIKERLDGSFISKLKPIKTEFITESGLRKLACCNLSESFENSATVDVGYTDAVSGAKQIQMLGLAGTYSQLMYENMPYIRGVAAPFGLSYVPGTWMQSIQVSKGTASVINGYESVTGQINIEFKKPEHTEERLFVNIYGNDEARLEANVHAKASLNDNLSTLLLTHFSTQQSSIDHNGDGFLDAPKSHQLNLFNRWSYEKEGSMHSQFGIGIIDEERNGGSKDWDKTTDWYDQGLYGVNLKTRRYQGFGKVGFFLDKEGHTNIGTQFSGTYHDQKGFYGLRSYEALQKSLYANIILQGEITEEHKYSAGISYQYDDYKETISELAMNRIESVPGVFAQYTFDLATRFTAIAGARADFNSEYGTFFTPRLHLRYQILENTTLRASAGKGYRTASVVSENSGYLASSRQFVIADDLKAEEAWNYGINLTQEFPLANERKATITIDFYRTDFVNQVVADPDQNAQKIVFYNLDGKSYSNSFQTEVTVEPFKGFTTTAAFRLNDVKITESGTLKEKPFVSKYKGLLTLSYTTRFEKWSFDFTTQFNGAQRLPDTQGNPEEYRRDDYSPEYFILHGQITRRFKNFDVYAGAENLTNYTQHHPIIGSDDPYGPYFDSSMIWGPLLGRMIYAGVRLTLN